MGLQTPVRETMLCFCVAQSWNWELGNWGLSSVAHSQVLPCYASRDTCSKVKVEVHSWCTVHTTCITKSLHQLFHCTRWRTLLFFYFYFYLHCGKRSVCTHRLCRLRHSWNMILRWPNFVFIKQGEVVYTAPYFTLPHPTMRWCKQTDAGPLLPWLKCECV